MQQINPRNVQYHLSTAKMGHKHLNQTYTKLIYSLVLDAEAKT